MEETNSGCSGYTVRFKNKVLLRASRCGREKLTRFIEVLTNFGFHTLAADAEQAWRRTQIRKSRKAIRMTIETESGVQDLGSYGD